MKYAIAVFDIGKTNKKLIIFDNELNELAITYKSFPTIEFKATGKSEWQLEAEDINGIKNWIIESLSKYSGQFPIKVIAFSTHGATFAAIDKNGDLAFPVLSYTNEPGDEFHEKFFDMAGDPLDLQLETGTAHFGALLNIAKGIYFLKDQFPDSFSNIKRLLLYSQFFGYMLTGRIAAEFTYAGCHTYLWNFNKSGWSSVADKLEISNKLPSDILYPYSVLGKIQREIALKTGLSDDVIVTAGIHDSNASLLPYLIKEREKDFILNSTGTWCVVMHPMENYYFEKDELGKVVFYNLSVFGKPVKTAIFTGGLEHDEYMRIIQKINKTDEFPGFEEDIYKNVIAEKSLFILPTILKGSGQFPDSPARIIENGRVYGIDDIKSGKNIPGFFKDPIKARAVLNLSLAIQTKIAFERAGLHSPSRSPGSHTRAVSIYTEGGFRKNLGYNLLVSSLFPNSRLMLSNLKEATAFGTALTAKAAIENLQLETLKDYIKIETETVNKLSFPGLSEYTNAFLKLLTGR